MSRLEEIKNNAKGLTDEEGYFADVVQLDVSDYAYLYEQAERVEELEKQLNSSRHGLFNCNMCYQRATEQNQRYKQALGDATSELYHAFITGDIDNKDKTIREVMLEIDEALQDTSQ